jgi:hypothetical protein
VKILLKQLKQNTLISRIKTTTFYQGKIARWGLAWSYIKKENINKFISKQNKKNIRPYYNKIRFIHNR